MKTFIIALVALAAGVGIGIPAIAVAESSNPDTFGGYQVQTVEVSAPITAGQPKAVSAHCPDESWAATGGGFTISGASTGRIIDNRRVFGDPGTEYWLVTITGPTTTGTLYVHAVCTKLG